VSKSAKAGADDLPFEEALQKLETIVETMESGELPLEQLLARFEEGTRLARQCQERLADAEVKIQKLEQNLAGDLTVKPMAVEPVAGE
jgi:exodeoxyribonuclease VII small subunit